MDAAECQSMLASWQSQNAELRNRLYAEYQRTPRASSAVPLLVGVVLGIAVTLVGLYFMANATLTSVTKDLMGSAGEEES